MGLDTVFQNASVLAFTVFDSLTVESSYVEVNDDGINPKTEVAYPVKIIPTTLSENELKNISFKNLIQPTDSIALIAAPNLGVPVTSGNLIRTSTDEFSIIATEIDPAEALWILLLRKP